MTRILGIDPGSRCTGVGIIDADGDRSRVVHYAAIRTGGGDFPDRLGVIFAEVSALITTHQPEQAAVETVFVSKNALSALKLGQARGAAVCAAVNAGLPVAEYAPRAIKQAIVGTGKAAKSQMQHMMGVLLNIREELPEDAADALAVALCHHHTASSQTRMQHAVRQL